MEQLVKKYTKNPIMGDIYNLSNLKILLDDLLNEYLVARGHRRSYMYLDMRNAMGLVSTVIATIAALLSVYYKYDSIKRSLGICLAIYFTLFALLCVVVYFEGGKFYYESFHVITRADNAPMYVVLVYKNGEPVPLKHTKSILNLFYDTGRMDHELFLNDIELLFSKK